MERQSNSMSLHDQRESSELQPNRAKLPFGAPGDPNLPFKKKGIISLPSGDDYIFRIQVISTIADVDTHVFKKAVQGLVKICFPQDFLDEIGIEVVAQHMREEGASKHNISKMAEIFHSEMLQCIMWMLAEYLDTSAKVEASVNAIMAATASRHGAKTGESLLGHVIASLQSLREGLSQKSTTGLADNTETQTLTFDTHSFRSPDRETHEANSGYGASAASKTDLEKQAEDRQTQELEVATEKSKKRKRSQTMVDTDRDHEARTHQKESIEQSNNNIPHFTRDGKASKISTSWRWSLEDDVPFTESIVQFKRMSDLFAYHALPIVRQRLGKQTHRKQLRQEMETMLVSMPDGEFALWITSFEKLKNADASMLDRQLPALCSSKYSVTSTTPTPVVTYKHNPQRVQPSDNDRAKTNETAASTSTIKSAPMKWERQADEIAEADARKVRVLTREAEPQVSAQSPADKPGLCYHAIDPDKTARSSAPVPSHTTVRALPIPL